MTVPPGNPQDSGGQVFENVTVLPGRQPYEQPFLSDGGPCWPDFDQQIAARHQRGGMPVDTAPTPDSRPPEYLSGTYVWGGYAQPHFGHLVAEHLTRLPMALAHMPDARVLFYGPAGETLETLPKAFFALCAWFGLSKERIALVTRPVSVARLIVWPQGEQIGQGGDAAYLERLDQIAAGHLPAHAQPRGTLYVTRAGMCAEGKAAHLGEGYLVERLRALGCAVIDPARASLADQMAAYESAEHLVFAEGSAVHGRQLLGVRAQDIDVLNRRKESWLGHGVLPGRARRFTRHAVAADEAAILYSDGSGLAVDSAVALFDLDALFRFFAGCDLDLARAWDMDAYRSAQKADLLAWLDHHLMWRGATLWQQLGTVPEFVERHGFQDCLSRTRARAPFVPIRRHIRVATQRLARLARFVEARVA